MTYKEEVLKEFGEWIKTQPIYVGGGLTDREVLVIRDGKFESAIEVYLKERSGDDYSRGCTQGYEDAKLAYERRMSNMEMPIPKFVEDKTYTDCLDEDARQASIPDTQYDYPIVNKVGINYLHQDSITKSNTQI